MYDVSDFRPRSSAPLSGWRRRRLGGPSRPISPQKARLVSVTARHKEKNKSHTKFQAEFGIIQNEIMRRTDPGHEIVSEVLIMIEFACKLCGEKLHIPDHFAGRPFKCTKCGIDGIVPEMYDKIKFHCESCGQYLRVPRMYEGRQAKCPKCKSAVVVPPFKLKPEPDLGSETVTIVCPMCDAVLHPSKDSKGKMIPCPKCDTYIET